MTKTLADMEERMANIEKNIEKNNTTVETKITNLERKIDKNTAETEGKLEAVNNNVDGLKTALIQAFNEMKDVLITKEGKKEENSRKIINKPSGDKENIIVAGGSRTNSVEMFNWRQRTWSPLQPMPKNRWAATSFIYKNHMTIAGGCCDQNEIVLNSIGMNIDPNPDLLTHWSYCPFTVPKLWYKNSVLYIDQLMVLGASDLIIRAVQLVPPYTVKTLSRIPEPRYNHSMKIFDDNLLIVGGSLPGGCKDNLSIVVLYDIKKNELKQLSPLPYKVSDMATVRWGDNIVVIGGVDKHGNELDTVIIYNVETEQSHMLPSMRCKRRGCTAVVIENNIVVLGGLGEQGDLKSVEGFNFERYSWEELPEMSEARCWHTAVVV
ncbi:kelch domain-containing protein 8B-like [Dendronephthya gigantea]|uniref:kelch domain-containing protein 8B-like n=1 Tax=Dendronephthya gigantea TaxID=151771 RepID=UPI00106C05FB|nr:kelch domain-containing protein 8B-like [Dendronephthya gigantea]